MWMRPFSYPASAQSRAIIVVSDTLGIPAMPSSALTEPSCIEPAPESAGSSSCSAMTPPHRRWYCSALRIIPAFVMGLPSSLKAMAPSSRSSAMSVSSSPRMPRVTVATKPTGTRASRAAESRSAPSTGALSIVGEVFAIATTATNPPAAAERVPVSRSSLYSWPGVRRCTCGSTKPGTSMLALGLDDLGALGRVEGAVLGELGDLAVADEDVERGVDPGARVEDVRVADEQRRGGRGGADERGHASWGSSGLGTRSWDGAPARSS